MSLKITHYVLAPIFGFAVLILAVVGNGCQEMQSQEVRGVEIAKLTQAPNVPPPIERDYPTKVIVNLEVKELTKRLADGVEYTFWTFGGDVPGSFIRVREGDLVEFHLSNNPANKLPHNIDLHAVSGQGGGASASFTAPGHTSVFTFTAKNPGLFVYHCATAPVGLHIANGMYGLIFVQPREGMPKVDKEYYIMQSEFYTDSANGKQGLQQFNLDKALQETPDYVVFNGSVGALTGDKAMKAEAGQTVRLFVGNGGPNLVSSFHVIGEIFDEVYNEGGTMPAQKNVGTTLIPSGGSAIVDFKIDVPGKYILVDHSIFRAFNKGAIAMIDAGGKDDKNIYSGKIEDQLYTGDNSFTTGNEGQAPQPQASGSETPAQGISDPLTLGKQVYAANCQACHQQAGQGIPNTFPPLANSDWLAANGKYEAIKNILKGRTGEITVNGKKYNGMMPPLPLTDEQIAAVIKYVYKEFNQKNIDVKPEEVNKLRATRVAGR